jgi:hypothetical protein
MHHVTIKCEQVSDHVLSNPSGSGIMQLTMQVGPALVAPPVVRPVTYKSPFGKFGTGCSALPCK